MGLSKHKKTLVLRKKRKRMEKVDDIDSVNGKISNITSSQVGPNLYAIPKRALRATSHTGLKALDHGNVRALIGRKGGHRPS